MMKDAEQVIGVLYDYEDSILATVHDIKNSIIAGSSNFRLQQYFDWRCSTNLRRFVYDPFTGKKIDWKKLKEDNKESFK